MLYLRAVSGTFAGEIAIKQVIRYVAGTQCFCHSAVRVSFAYWTEEAIFVLGTHAKKPRANPADTFIITLKDVCSQDQPKISPVSCFTVGSNVS